MTNDEIKQFFIDNGAFGDFKIINTPIFLHYDIVFNNNNRADIVSSNHSVNMLSVNNIQNFIFEHINIPSFRCYIYNDYETDFNINMKYIRVKNVDITNNLIIERFYKLKKIKSRINEKIIMLND
jgi:hypothetical protein